MYLFPAFAAKLKSIVRFLCNELVVVKEIGRCLRRDGHPSLADMVEKASLVTFANLASVTEVLNGFIGSLAAHFDAAAFADQRDTTELKNVVATFRSAAWHRQLRFVTWFVEQVSALMD